jgi:tetratricopeptide (TPR) repeat protein
MAKALELAGGGGSAEGVPALVLRRMGVPRRHVDRARQVVTAAAAALAVVLLFAIRAWMGGDDGQPGAEVRYVVLEWVREDATETERMLSRLAARTLRDQLRGWNSVTVVSGPALEGPAADLRIAGVSQSTFTFGTSLAERFDADFRLYVAASESGGISPASADRGERTVQITAWIYDPIEPIQRDELTATGQADNLSVITAEIALQLLEIQGEAGDYHNLQARSPDHRAHQEFQEGQEALWAWRLAEAHRLFEAAIALDPGFALAHHLLAETMYWEIARDEERLRELGPRIEYHSREADREGTGDRLRPGERNAVNAFRAFWTGDYDLARGLYDNLIAFDRFDLESLVLRGAVEIEDPMLGEREDGSLSPRQNLNVARAVFDTASVLNAEWELSWGHLHSIDRQVAATAYLGECPGFEMPGDVFVTPYEIRDAVEQRYFCPIVEADTIGWVTSDRNVPPGDSASIAAAAVMHRRTTELLAHAAMVEQDQPRHHEELATFLLWEQHLPRCEADPQRTDSLRASARQHLERALEMRGDTVPQDRVTLASLYLGSGDLESALASVERALDEMNDWESLDGTPPAPAAANPFLAAGRAHPAVNILERVWGENTMGIADPQNTARSIDTYGMYATLNALSALGTLGASGPDVADRLDRLQRTWRDAPLSDRDRVALRSASMPYVGPALVHSPDAWEDWFDGWDTYSLEFPAIWKGIFAAEGSPPDLVEARVHLDEVLEELGADPIDGPVTPVDLYLPLVLAERIGAGGVEAELRRRFARCALGLDNFDPGWAMRSSLGMND